MSLINFHGHSMFPLIREGAKLDVHFYPQPKPLEDIEVGQVVLIKDQSEWMVHRVVQHDGRKVTKGDWTLPFDKEQWVWGEVSRVDGVSSALLSSPHLGELSRFVSFEHSSLKRKYFRLKILFYVFVNKLLKRGC